MLVVRIVLLFVSAALAIQAASSHRVLIRTTEGKTLEGDVSNLRAIGNIRPEQIVSLHSGAPASAYEKARIDEGMAAIGGKDRKASDHAVEELTAIGIPVMTPLLKAYKDTDQHEPRPLYRLFEKVMPSHADGFDRTLSLIRTKSDAIRAALPTEGSLTVRGLDGKSVEVPWAQIRMLAIRQKSVSRLANVHSIQHSIQIEYLDTGIILSADSKVDSSTKGFVRLSWDTDSWASDANGLTKPGAPAYKSHLVNGHPFGALIARVGAGSEPVFFGVKTQKSGLGAGRLGLAVNDNPHWQNNLGTFTVLLTVTDAYNVGHPQ